MKKQTEKPNNNYGQVYLPILTNTELNVTDRVVYSLLSVKQGSSDAAHLTQSQIADSLSLTLRTIGRAFDKLKAAGIIESATKGWKVNQPDIINHYGKVEQIVLGSTFLSNHAKLLYTYYAVVTGGIEKCTKGADTITAALGITKRTYQKAFKELVENTLITTGKRRTVHGFVNVVAPRRLAKANPKDFLPASWFKEDKVVLDTTDINFYEVAARINAEANRTKSTGDAVISAPLIRLNGNHLEGQKGTTNTNHNINQDIHPNSKPDLAGNTAVGSTEGGDFELNPRYHHSNFRPEFVTIIDKTKLLLITLLFDCVRKSTGNHHWRMTNLDFDRIVECFDVLGLWDETGAALTDYENFLKEQIISKRKRAGSFSYYVTEGIMDAYNAYRGASEFGGSDFSLDDRTMRHNYGFCRINPTRI